MTDNAKLDMSIFQRSYCDAVAKFVLPQLEELCLAVSQIDDREDRDEEMREMFRNIREYFQFLAITIGQ